MQDQASITGNTATASATEKKDHSDQNGTGSPQQAILALLSGEIHVETILYEYDSSKRATKRDMFRSKPYSDRLLSVQALLKEGKDQVKNDDRRGSTLLQETKENDVDSTALRDYLSTALIPPSTFFSNESMSGVHFDTSQRRDVRPAASQQGSENDNDDDIEQSYNESEEDTDEETYDAFSFDDRTSMGVPFLNCTKACVAEGKGLNRSSSDSSSESESDDEEDEEASEEDSFDQMFFSPPQIVGYRVSKRAILPRTKKYRRKKYYDADDDSVFSGLSSVTGPFFDDHVNRAPHQRGPVSTSRSGILITAKTKKKNHASAKKINSSAVARTKHATSAKTRNSSFATKAKINKDVQTQPQALTSSVRSKETSSHQVDKALLHPIPLPQRDMSSTSAIRVIKKVPVRNKADDTAHVPVGNKNVHASSPTPAKDGAKTVFFNNASTDGTKNEADKSYHVRAKRASSSAQRALSLSQDQTTNDSAPRISHEASNTAGSTTLQRHRISAPGAVVERQPSIEKNRDLSSQPKTIARKSGMPQPEDKQHDEVKKNIQVPEKQNKKKDGVMHCLLSLAWRSAKLSSHQIIESENEARHRPGNT